MNYKLLKYTKILYKNKFKILSNISKTQNITINYIFSYEM